MRDEAFREGETPLVEGFTHSLGGIWRALGMVTIDTEGTFLQGLVGSCRYQIEQQEGDDEQEAHWIEHLDRIGGMVKLVKLGLHSKLKCCRNHVEWSG